MSTISADIDRRVSILSGLANGQEAPERISGLREFPFVVLLGEPGIGKSTVLAREAARDGVPMLTVREIMTGTEVGAGEPLYLDALDEYRSDGGAEDKVHVLANAIGRSDASRWRLSCRSEDWRKAADIAPISKTTGGKAIIVAQLLPLEHGEAAAILKILGEDDPDHFLTRAHAFGAVGFVETPLGLKLLHEAVKEGGAWPENRFGLFASATRSLSFERSDVRTVAPRHGIDQILDAAGETFLLMLASGARAVWRSNKEPPRAEDVRAYVLRDEIGIEHGLTSDMVDTPLFKGEGEVFEPMHRTVAEYLGGRALASAVRGVVRPALPLDRALALITGHDGRPPTELRGLFAWFVAHLASMGEVETARRLMDLDPVTVMSYGDAAVFKTAERRLLLTNLGRHDPYFKISEIGVTSVGGLAGEDLAGDFAAILNDVGDGTHRLMTVFDALTTGRPVKSLRPLLRSVALDATRSEWQRGRAIEAYLNGEDDPASLRREIFDALETEPPSLSREAIRAQLAGGFAPGALKAVDVRSILVAYRGLRSDNTIGRLRGLERRIEKEPMPQLFDDPVSGWLPASDDDDRQRDRYDDIGQFLDRALASAIRSTPDLTASTIWRWIANVRRQEWSELKRATVDALSSWLDGEGSEAELFNAILAGDKLTEGPWVVINKFITIVRRNPSSAVVRHILDRARQASEPATRERLLAISVQVARIGKDEALYWMTYDKVARCGSAELLGQLTTSKIEQWMIDQARGSAKRASDDEKQRREYVRGLKPHLTELSLGRYPQVLDTAAHWYFEQDETGGVRGVTEQTDVATAAAIVAGWRHLAISWLKIDAAKLGRAEGEGRRYFVETAAVAGVDILLSEGSSAALSRSPIEVAIAVLKAAWIVTNQDRRKMIENWAIERLNADPSEGAEQLVNYWNSALDAGAAGLPGISDFQGEQPATPVLAIAVDRMLERRPTMNVSALRSGLRAAARTLGRERLVELTSKALANPEVRDAVRNVWTVVAFVLNPSPNLARKRGLKKAAAMLVEDDTNSLISALFEMFGVERLPIRGLTVRALGPRVTPNDQFSSNSRVTEPQRSSEAVRNAVNGLTGDPRTEAGQLLAELAADPTLSAWRAALQHAHAENLRLQRDRRFKHPTAVAVRDALRRGPPVNAADLRAIVISELNRLRSELRTTATTPWKRYWKVGSRGTVEKPLIENECRDNLLDRLLDRLAKYHIAAAEPEVRRGEGTRADVVIVSGAGRNLPIEAKRHFHADLWKAAATQLQVYASDPGADGFGIYLVFWFGNGRGRMPPRPDGTVGPSSASQLEEMLANDLPDDLKQTTNIVVFDVSDQSAAKSGKVPKQGKAPKKRKAAPKPAAKKSSKAKAPAAAVKKKAAKRKAKGRRSTS